MGLTKPIEQNLLSYQGAFTVSKNYYTRRISDGDGFSEISADLSSAILETCIKLRREKEKLSEDNVKETKKIHLRKKREKQWIS